MSNELTNISSEYDLLSIFRNLGNKYFGSDLSEQRIGMFGYVTEAMAHMTGASILDASMRAYEYNIVTAKKLKTLMYNASIYGIDISSCTPPSVNAYISVPTVNINGKSYENCFGTEIEKNESSNQNPTYALVLEKNTVITIQNYPFMFEYDIEIKATWNPTINKYSYSVFYLTEGDTDPTSLIDNGKYIYPKANTIDKLSNKYIQSYIQSYDNNGVIEEYLVFPVKLRQMKLNSSVYPITKNDIVSLSHIEFLYDDQFSHFNVYYRTPNSNTWSFIETYSIYDLSLHENNAFKYEIDSESKKIILSSDNFEPVLGSEIRVDIYSSQGTSANDLTYIADGEDVIVTLESVEDRHNYIGLVINALPFDTVVGGKDCPTITEIKNMLINKKSTLNSINSEYDLLNYITSKDTTNSYSFIKKTSDIFKRQYSAFSILRNKSNDIIGTSTLPYVHEDDYDGGNFTYTLKAGTPLVNAVTYKNEVDTNIAANAGIYDYYDEYENILEVLFPDNDFSATNGLCNANMSEKKINDIGTEIDIFSDQKNIVARENDGIKIYSSPYTICYSYEVNGDDVKENTSIFNTSYSELIPLNEIDSNTNSNINFAANSVSINRNAIFGEEEYRISISLLPNGNDELFKEIYKLPKDDENVDPLLNTIMLLGFIYNKDGSISGFINDIRFESYENSIYTFSGSLKVIDEYSVADKKIKANKSVYDAKEVANASGGVKILKEITSPCIEVSDFYISFAIYTLDVSSIIDQIKEGTVTLQNPFPVYKSDTNEIKTITLNSGTEYPLFSMAYNNGTSTQSIMYDIVDVYDTSGTSISLYNDMTSMVDASVYSELDDEDNPSTITLKINELPVIQYSEIVNPIYTKLITETINNTKVNLYEMDKFITNNFSFDYKFFRTYGPGRYFKLKSYNSGSDDVNIGSLDINIEFKVILLPGVTTPDSEISDSIKRFIKSKIETLNSGNYTIYISNIITEIEKSYSDTILACNLISINGYSSDYCILSYEEPKESINPEEYKKELANYIPEYINVPINNIKIDITHYIK